MVARLYGALLSADSPAPSQTNLNQALNGVMMTLRMRQSKFGLLFFLLLLSLSTVSSDAQMLNPDIDRPDQPFSYFSQPTDIIGVMNAPSATEITPEGFLYTGFGELMFFTGPERKPISVRIRTLEQGYLPIVSYTVEEEGIQYRFTALAAQIPQPEIDEASPTGQIADFMRVTASNHNSKPRAAFVTASIRYEGEQTTGQPQPDNRFRRPAEAERIGDYQQPGEPFRSDWSYRMDSGACLRENRILYRFPLDPAPHAQLTFRSHYNRIQELSSNNLKLTPTTPVCTVEYRLVLKPNESRSLDFVMPLNPATQDSQEAANLERVSFETAHQGVVDLWRRLLARGMQVELPESKPVETFYASLVYDLLGRNIIRNQFVQTAGQFQYHRFYLRDSADIVRMYDVTGYPDIGGQVLSFFLERQQPDGNFLSQAGQYDGWGQAMWAFGEHLRITHDKDFAAKVFPAMVRGVDWLSQARAKDPLHLIPATNVRDNEYVPGHLTGYNFLALDGLDAAIEIARALGRKPELERFEKERKDYADAFFPLLDEVSASQGGVLPPCLDASDWKGTDWGNLLSITPEPLLDPWDPRVTATLKKMQAHYQEGISTYAEPNDGVFLHHYLTIKNTLSELVRGEPEQAIREFYAELLHTSSTHSGFEYAIRPWGTRDFEGNLAPHAWFAADYRNLLRNMLVREQGHTLHLLSAISPEWFAPGKRIAVSGATTWFGRVSFEFETVSDQAAVLRLNNAFSDAPGEILLHLPWFVAADRATVDGKPVNIDQNGIHLAPSAHDVRIEWRQLSHPQMNYERTVVSFEQEYRRRWTQFITSGEIQAGADDWQVPE
jgi:hypothetical protein